MVVNLAVVAARENECAGLGVVGNVANVSGQGRALARLGVPSGSAQASLDGGTNTLARVLVVRLRQVAGWDVKCADGLVVPQVALVGGKGVALAGLGVEGGAGTVENCGALTAASELVVGEQVGGASRDRE